MAMLSTCEDEALSMSATPGLSNFDTQWKKHHIERQLFQNVFDAKHALDSFVSSHSGSTLRAAAAEQQMFVGIIDAEGNEMSYANKKLKGDCAEQRNKLFASVTDGGGVLIPGLDGTLVELLPRKGYGISWKDLDNNSVLKSRAERAREVAKFYDQQIEFNRHCSGLEAKKRKACEQETRLEQLVSEIQSYEQNLLVLKSSHAEAILQWRRVFGPESQTKDMEKGHECSLSTDISQEDRTHDF